MPRTIYALFAGIDDYASGVNPLKGCVNDVTRLRDLKDLGWVVDAGAVHGIPQPVDGGESTQLAIFSFDMDAIAFAARVRPCALPWIPPVWMWKARW